MAWKKAIEVKILANGVVAEEYNDDEESHGPHSVTKYIEAISGAEFEVQHELKPSFRFPSQHLVFEKSMDGKALDNGVVSMEAPEGRPPVRKRDNLGHAEKPWTEWVA